MKVKYTKGNVSHIFDDNETTRIKILEGLGFVKDKFDEEADDILSELEPEPIPVINEPEGSEPEEPVKKNSRGRPKNKK